MKVDPEQVHVVRAICPEDWGELGPPDMTYAHYEAELVRWEHTTPGGGLWDEELGGPWTREYPRARAEQARANREQLELYLYSHKVPDKWTQVYWHHYEDGKTLEDTAETLSMTLAAVRRNLSQLRRAALGARPTARGR